MDSKNYNLICVIINHGLGSKVARHCKKQGAKYISIVMGRGSVDAKILEFLGITDIKKEIIFALVHQNDTLDLLKSLNNEYHFDRLNHGIAFVLPTSRLINLNDESSLENTKNQSEGDFMYDMITTIVEKGKAEDVINMAKLGGATGGTIINARGAGDKETSRVFSIEIEPEKEIVMIISKVEMTEKIVDSIKNTLDEKDILFVQNVKYAYGLYE